MNVTADTITDEQIRELHAIAYRSGDYDTGYLCSDALAKGVANIAKRRKAARARCAEIINARLAVKQ